jgi:lipopolysaccharide biosynthesis protein
MPKKTSSQKSGRFSKLFKSRLFRIFRKSPDKPFRKFVAKSHEASEIKPNLVTGYVSRTDSLLDQNKLSVRTIAFYLPQYHPIAENDLWWGKGFTEWTNVTRAIPQFVGHHQPILPGDLGFYDLRLPEIMKQQVAMANDYGIHGFCFHHYWFGGKRLLEMPVQQLLKNPEINIHFCLCWANENWSRRWDGSESDVLMAQNHSPEDDIAFIDDLIPSFQDPRYIRVDGKPVLIVYRATLFPDMAATAKRWRARVREFGIDDLYLVAAKSFDVGNPLEFGFDAGVEFPPHQAAGVRSINHQLQLLNPKYKGKIFEYSDLAEKYSQLDPAEFTCHKTVVPGWDNTARKLGAGRVYTNSSPAAYAKWLDDALDVTMRRAPQERLLFINAWNEWGEGAYLEPDRRSGYAYLNATASVLSQTYHDIEVEAFIERQNGRFQKSSDTAVVLHLYYGDLFQELLSEYLKRLNEADFLISVRFNAPLELLEEIVTAFPNVYLIKSENRGRDMYPFLVTMERLIFYQYQYACKIHTKKSKHRQDGMEWRNQILNSLVGAGDPIAEVRKVFASDSKTGILAPIDSIEDLSKLNHHLDNTKWLDRMLPRMGRSQDIGKYAFLFPAGSMFWFRVDALQGLMDLKIERSEFAHETAQLDGTLAHTLERLILISAEARGYQFREMDMNAANGLPYFSEARHPQKMS